MKRALTKCLALCIAVPLVARAAPPATQEPKKEEAAPAAKPGGKLEVESLTVDVGDVVRGQEAKATFTLKNVGTETLKILSAKPG